MKKLMAAAVAVALGASAFAGTYYVDANNGNDDWDGSAAVAAPDVETSKIGPKKTLNAAAKLAKATARITDTGDTLVLAPGHYKEGTYDDGSGNLYRANLPAGCVVRASGRKDETFIEGAASTEPSANANGCGPGAVKCLSVGNWVVVRGVTVCNGRSPTTGSTAGAVATGGTTGYLVDCVISNIWATGRAGCFYYGPGAIRCYFKDCHGGGTGDISEGGGTLWNCVVDCGNSGYKLYTTTSRNCTFIGTAQSVRDTSAYNDLLIAPAAGGNNGNHLYSCVSRGAFPAKDVADAACQANVGESLSRIDPATYEPIKGFNVGIDAGSNLAYTASFPTLAAVADQKDLDFLGNRRIIRGRIDVGAVEMDWGVAFSRDLATEHVRVTEFSETVHETADGKVALPDGASLSLVWEIPGGIRGELDYSFTAAIPSGATLKVYCDGAAEPTWTMDETTGMPFIYKVSVDGGMGGEQTLRFVAEGGEVALSAFYDCGVIDITDSSTGLTVTGAEKGRTRLQPGAYKTVRISRNFTSEFTVSGFTVNGEFVSFDDHADDWAWERVVSGPASSIRVEAVYPTTKAWYVDPVKGDDGNDGRTKTRAVRTLVAAAKLVGTTSTTRYQPKVNTIYLAEGTYAEGIYTNGTSYARGYVPNHTRLVGLGTRERTVILGARSTDPSANANGCGPGAVRCLYLGVDSFVRGVTLTGGRSPLESNDGALLGYGGSSGVWLIDCVLSNNCSAARGGVSAGSPYALRCYIADNYAPTAGGAFQSSYAANCLFGPQVTFASCDPMNVSTAYNCTYLGTNGRNQNTYDGLHYAQDSGADSLHNCLLVTAAKTPSKKDETTQDALGAAALPHAADYTPTAGSLAIDYGSEAYLTRLQGLMNGLVDPFGDLDYLIDYNGRPRIVGGRVDVGCCEYDWRTDPPRGLTLVLTDKGDGMTEVSVSRNFTSAKPTVGFTLGDEAVMFDELPGKTWTETVAADDLQGLMLRAVYNENPTDWYVDAVSGDDANPGYLPDCPKHTLTGIVAVAKSGHIVHAAPGVYREGAKKDGDTMTRVVIPAGVGLVADGDGEHVIEGVVSQELGHSGPDSVRCVACGAGAWVKGFVLRNGSTRVTSSTQPGAEWAYGDNGGGIAGGTAIDCIITNCYAVRGGGSSGATLIRCVLKDSHLESGATNVYGVAANTTATGMYNGNAYDSYIGDDTLNLGVVRNCRCYHLWGNVSTSKVRAYNTFVETENGNIAFTNCVVGVNPRSTSIVGEGTVVGKTIAFDAKSRPVAGQTLAIDRGKAEYYVYPDAFAHEQGVADVAGGQRVYNGTIDIGPGEYDWRGDFAKRLRRGVSVEAASENVTTNAVAGLNLANGETLEFTCTAKTDGKVSFRVTGAGSVTVTYGGEPLEPVEGVYSVRMDAGTSELFAVTYAGEGVATVTDVILPCLGSLLLIR